MSERLMKPFLRNAGKWLSVSAGVVLLALPSIVSAQAGGYDGGKVKVEQPALTANTSALEALQLQFEQRRRVLMASPLYRELVNSNHPLAKAIRENPDIALQFIDERGPAVFTIDNAIAAQTISTDEVHPGGASPYNRDGSLTTSTELGIWDGGSAMTTHQELTGRIVLGDGAASHWHSTHVAGTMIASGVVAAAQGMSYNATGMRSYEWTNDMTEMAAAAAAGMYTSNHSYGYITGWNWDSGGGFWVWYGDVNVSTVEDPDFGAYTTDARDWDNIAFNAPQYLICKSAGNDRNDGPGAIVNHYHWDGSIPGWVWTNDYHPDDFQSGGYDTMSPRGSAKNILTVGAVNDIPGGYVSPPGVVQSTFSGWGPTDDGRVKPDIVGNGVGLYSAHNATTASYASSDGTSMSTPNVSGSTNLLVQAWMYWGGWPTVAQEAPAPRSATVKAIVVNTADEAGAANGPDYQNGWGLMNTQRAMDIIAHNSVTLYTENYPALADMGAGETNLVKSTGDEFYFNVDSPNDLPKITIAWTDPAGTAQPFTVDPAGARLVNDLDIRMVNLTTGAVTYPWRLNPASPGTAATQADNFRDNVEKINMYNPTPGDYQLRVTHKGGTLINGSQDYSITWHDITPVQPPLPTPGSAVNFDNNPNAAATVAGWVRNNASGGYYLKALKDYSVTAIGLKADLLEKQSLTVSIYEATNQVRGALLATASSTVYHPGDVYQYVPINFTFEECKEYDVNVAWGNVKQMPGFHEHSTAPAPFDVGGSFRVLNSEWNGNAGDMAYVTLGFIGSATSADYVQDLDPMQGTPTNSATGAGNGDQRRGFYFRANQTVALCALGWMADLVPTQKLTARLYDAVGTTRGALIAEGEAVVTSSGMMWHDVPINYVLEEGKEYDIDVAFGTINSWPWWSETLLTEPFIKGPIEVVDGEITRPQLNQWGDASNTALAHFRVHYDEGVGATALDITEPFLTGTNPGSAGGGYDFGHFVTAIRDQELTTVGWMADIPLGQSITINVYNASGFARGTMLTSGTLVSNGPGMRWHDVPVAATLIGGNDYDIAIDWTGAPGAGFNFWAVPVHSPYNAYGMLMVTGSEFGGTYDTLEEYVHMRVNSCLSGLATGVEPRRNTPVPFALHQPYPNPVSSTATIDFSLDREASVTMNVYDVAGRRVATLLENARRPAGLSSVEFNTRNLPTGIYFVKMQTAVKSVTRKITVMR